MTADLAGLRVSVLLNEPYNKRIEGRVSDVKNRQLFLQDVLFENGSRAGYFVIPGQDICDLEVIRQPQAPQVGPCSRMGTSRAGVDFDTGSTACPERTKPDLSSIRRTQQSTSANACAAGLQRSRHSKLRKATSNRPTAP